MNTKLVITSDENSNNKNNFKAINWNVEVTGRFDNNSQAAYWPNDGAKGPSINGGKVSSEMLTTLS